MGLYDDCRQTIFILSGCEVVLSGFVRVIRRRVDANKSSRVFSKMH